MEKKIPLIAVVGPTASGKTSLGVEIAKAYNGEVVSADSMQVYKGMDIATAKPTQNERQGIAHHMISFLEPDVSFSVAQFCTLAKEIIEGIFKRGKVPVLVGGTGLYISSLLNNIAFFDNTVNESLREKLTERLKNEGAEVLLEELRSFDPETAEKLNAGNGRRIIRAIEVYKASGVTQSKQNELSKKTLSPYNDVRIGLTCRNRENLYTRINERVDKMLELGLLQEAENFLKKQVSDTAKMAIGHKELIPYFTKEKTLEEAIEDLKRETRRYAKRQLTWFRADEKINWILTDALEEEKTVFECAKEIIEKSNILN